MRSKTAPSDAQADAQANAQADTLKPEFSRIVGIAELSVAQTDFTFEASPGELAALTSRLGVDALEALSVRAVLQIIANGDVLANFAYSAQLEQHCGVTLQPMKSVISTEFTTTYSDNANADWGHDEEEFVDLDGDIEPPEPLVNGTIDVGEECVEHLALEIDPFPRVQGATFEGYSTDTEEEIAEISAKKNPFMVLSKLKSPKEKDE